VRFILNKLSIAGPLAEADGILSEIVNERDHMEISNLRPVPEGTSYEEWQDLWPRLWGTRGDSDVELDTNTEHDNVALLSFSYTTAESPFNLDFWKSVSKRYPISLISVSYMQTTPRYTDEDGYTGLIGVMAVSAGGEFAHENNVEALHLKDAPRRPSATATAEDRAKFYEAYRRHLYDYGSILHQGMAFQLDQYVNLTVEDQ